MNAPTIPQPAKPPTLKDVVDRLIANPDLAEHAGATSDVPSSSTASSRASRSRRSRSTSPRSAARSTGS